MPLTPKSVLLCLESRVTREVKYFGSPRFPRKSKASLLIPSLLWGEPPVLLGRVADIDVGLWDRVWSQPSPLPRPPPRRPPSPHMHQSSVRLCTHGQVQIVPDLAEGQSWLGKEERASRAAATGRVRPSGMKNSACWQGLRGKVFSDIKWPGRKGLLAFCPAPDPSCG